MKSLVIVIAAFVLGATAASAQRTRTTSGEQPWKKQIALDIGIQLPSGESSDALGLKMGFGSSATFYYQLLSRYTFLSASAGYHSFGTDGSNITMSVVPLLLGLKYNLTLVGVQPYIGFETGLYLISSANNGQAIDGSSITDFGFMPKLGVRVPIEPQFDFDANLKYNIVFADNSFSFAGINIGVAYTID